MRKARRAELLKAKRLMREMVAKRRNERGAA